MEAAYSAIGRDVFAAQLLETALVPIFEAFKMHLDGDYFVKTGGYVSDEAFRIPIKGMVKFLSERGQIAHELEERLFRYAEDRHTLVHRWIKQYGWPEEGDAEGFAPIIELASRVRLESEQLAQVFSRYIVKYANPDWSKANPEEHRQRMTELFKRAHLDE